MSEVKVESTFDRIRVRINGTVHLSLPQQKVNVQTWIYPDISYHAIELHTDAGVMLLEYEDGETWRKILDGLEQEGVI